MSHCLMIVLFIMGAIVSLFGNTGRTDDPDPATGLTSRDKYLVTSSWADVRKNPADNGVALLTMFFDKYPSYIQLFPFKDIPRGEWSTNPRFKAHCVSVIYGLSAVIDQINNTELLVATLTKLGETHQPRGVTHQGFHDLKVVVIELFSTFMSKEQVDAWKKTLDVAFPIILKAMKN